MRLTLDTHWSLAPLVSLVLLGGLWADRQLFHLPSADAAAYHETVAAAARSLPYRVEGWFAEDVPPPAPAIRLLRPNVLLGRRYQHAETGEQVTLLLVQTRDARDMGGHYPPACYRAHGWKEQQATRRTIRVGQAPVPLTFYRYTFESPERYSEYVIYNFFVVPDGTLDADRDGVQRAAADPRLKAFGAAQVQVLFDTPLSEERMDAVFRALVSSAWPVLEVMRGGGES